MVYSLVVSQCSSSLFLYHISASANRSYTATMKKHPEGIRVDKQTVVCPQCGKSFCKSSMTVHMRMHTGERPYTCLYCNKSFSQGNVLRDHVRTHTGEKPFVCPQCNKRFSKSSNLATHRKIHTGERPYQCIECGRRFTRLSHLASHQNVHTREKTFCCNACLRVFSTRGDLHRHQKFVCERPFTCRQGGSIAGQTDQSQHHRHVALTKRLVGETSEIVSLGRESCLLFVPTQDVSLDDFSTFMKLNDRDLACTCICLVA